MRLQVPCIFSWTVNKFKHEDTPDSEGNSNEASLASLPNGVTEENLMPPILETFIPAECLPDVIDVYVGDCFVNDVNFHPWKLSALQKYSVRKPIKFVRQYPARTHTDKGTFNTSSIQSRLVRMVSGDQVMSTDQILRLTC